MFAITICLIGELNIDNIKYCNGLKKRVNPAYTEGNPLGPADRPGHKSKINSPAGESKVKIDVKKYFIDMTWQDITISVVGIVFIYSMVPQIVYGFKKKRGVITYQFSVLNIIAIIVLAITYFSMGLLFSVIMSILSILLWTILLIQKMIYSD